MAGPFRMLYVQIISSLGDWLREFYQERTAPGDPLHELLDPKDLRGEVNAWGGPHITVSDALRVLDPAEFARICRSICADREPPEISFTDMDVHRTALVIECESKQLSQLRLELLEATSHLIEREPLTDREFQQTLERIQTQDIDRRTANESALEQARREYLAHNSPDLPTSVHFRLPFLVGLCRRMAATDDPAERSARRESLEYYLDFRQPPWYASSSVLHLTICSGLPLDPADEQTRKQLRDKYRDLLWNEVGRRTGRQGYRPPHLAIMGESETEKVHTRRWDGAVREHVEETRQQFVVVQQVPFKS